MSKYSNSDGERAFQIGPFVITTLKTEVNGFPRETVGVLIPSLGLNVAVSEVDEGALVSVLDMVCEPCGTGTVKWTPGEVKSSTLFSPDDTEAKQAIAQIMAKGKSH